MTEVVICGMQNDDLREGARKMMAGQIHRLVILDQDTQVIGIVSLADLAIKANDVGIAAELMRHISEPKVLQGT